MTTPPPDSTTPVEQPLPAGRRTAIQRSRILRLVVAIVVMLPLVVSAIYMWVLWDPTKKVDQMPVAIVNLDAGYGEGADRTDAGASVAQTLYEGQALGFRIVDEETATRGLAAGDYYFILTIPENFSESLKTITAPEAAPGLITVTFNDYITTKASSIGGSVMERIYGGVLKGISATTVGALVDGTAQLADGLRTAADGSEQLADGAQQLAGGTKTLAEGINDDLVPGVARAQAGSAQLADGSATLHNGLVTLQGGTAQLGDGATQIADGIEQLTGMVDLAQVTALLEQAQQVLPDSAPLGRVAELIGGLQRLEAGSRELANQLTDPSSQYLSGVNQLVDGSGQLAQGNAELAAGMVTLNEGVARLADGAGQLNDGAQRLEDGAGQLSDGLGEGAQRAPQFGGQDERMTLAQLLSTPVQKENVNIARAQFSGPGGTPTILVIASMLVVIVVFMCFRGHRFVTDDEHPRTLTQIGRRALAVAAVSLVVMTVVGIAAWLTRSDPDGAQLLPDPDSLWRVILMTAAATLMNVALVSVLYTLFGYVVGTLSSLAWLMLQLFSYGGVWMVETVPAPFQWLHPISPLTYVRDGYIAAFNGAPGFGTALAIVIGIGIVGALVNFGAAYVERSRYEAELRKLQVPPADPGRPEELVTAGH